MAAHQGTRVMPNQYGRLYRESIAKPCSYGRPKKLQPQDQEPRWWVCFPNGILRQLDPVLYTVTEHLDNTISVEQVFDLRFEGGWHGTLKNGVFEDIYD